MVRNKEKNIVNTKKIYNEINKKYTQKFDYK